MTLPTASGGADVPHVDNPCWGSLGNLIPYHHVLVNALIVHLVVACFWPSVLVFSAQSRSGPRPFLTSRSP